MPNPLILIAEDDPHIRRGLRDALESEGYRTREAANGSEALDQTRRQKPDLLLLDIMMPEKSGYDVCRELRQSGCAVPVIMLTAKGEEIDKVVGLQLGADDYVAKPFGIHELLARVAAVLRRARTAAPPPQAGEQADHYLFGEARVDRKTYTATLGRRESPLSARELKLLDLFHAHAGEVMSRDALLNAAWGIEYYGTTRTLDQHIAQLRKKVEADPAHPRAILTVHGIGYRYVARPERLDSPRGGG